MVKYFRGYLREIVTLRADFSPLISLLLALFLAACSGADHQRTDETSSAAVQVLQPNSGIQQEAQRSIKVDHQFEIRVGRAEKFGELETYTLFILTHEGRQLYIDSLLTEYEFGDKHYPLVRQLNEETFEVFVEVNNRPNKNYLTLFRVRGDRLVGTQKLPTFIADAANLDSDGQLELAGFWEWGETLGEGGNLITAYNPIIYYELRPEGIALDSALTVAENKEIFGECYGFEYDEDIAIKTGEVQKWYMEIQRLRGAE